MGRCGGDKILEHVLQKFSFVCQYCFIMVFNIRLPSFFCHVFRQSVFCGFAVYIIARPGNKTMTRQSVFCGFAVYIIARPGRTASDQVRHLVRAH